MSGPAKSIAELATGHVLEDRVRLSESRLWELQTQFYRSAGLAAWGDGGVPHQITCNPLIARGYAEVIVGFLRDCEAAGRLRRDRAVQIVELGSGSGRFAFHLLRELRPMLEATSLADQPVTVVLTDFEAAKLQALAAHPQLQAHREDGWLDFAVLDAARIGSLDTVRTWAGDQRIGGGPTVVIANYVFDSLPADAYAIGHGEVHESRLTVTADRADLDPLAPDALSHLAFSWTAEPGPVRPSPDFDRVLARYAASLDSTTVLLPTAALACVDGLAAAAGDSTLVLVADKGWVHLAELAGLGEPAIVPHTGCFSLMVDFDALARVIRSRGGAALLPAHTPRSLVVGAFVVGDNNIPETSRRYAAHLGESGPDDVFEVRNIEHAPLTLAQALATLRLSGWDSHVFLPMFPALLEMAPATSGPARTDLALALRRIWAGWFPIGETADVALCVGLILSAIGHHRDALGFFAQSHEQHGPNANAFLASAIARQGLCEPDAALKDLAEALALEPELDAARALVLEIEDSRGVDDGGAARS